MSALGLLGNLTPCLWPQWTFARLFAPLSLLPLSPRLNHLPSSSLSFDSSLVCVFRRSSCWLCPLSMQPRVGIGTVHRLVFAATHSAFPGPEGVLITAVNSSVL